MSGERVSNNKIQSSAGGQHSTMACYLQAQSSTYQLQSHRPSAHHLHSSLAITACRIALHQRIASVECDAPALSTYVVETQWDSANTGLCHRACKRRSSRTGQSPSGAGTEKSYPPYHLLTRHYASYVKTWSVDHPAANMSTPDCHEPDKASTVVWSAQADIEAPLTTSVRRQIRKYTENLSSPQDVEYLP